MDDKPDFELSRKACAIGDVLTLSLKQLCVFVVVKHYISSI